MRSLSLAVLGASLLCAMAALVGCESKQPQVAMEIAASPGNGPLVSPCGRWTVKVERDGGECLALIVTGDGKCQGHTAISSKQDFGYCWVASSAGSKLAINRYESDDRTTALVYDPVNATLREIDQDARARFSQEGDPRSDGHATCLASSPDGTRLLLRVADAKEDEVDETLGQVERFYVVDAQSGIAMNRFWKKTDIPHDWWVLHGRGSARDAYVAELLYRLERSQDAEERLKITRDDLRDVDDQRIDKVYARRLNREQTEEALYVAWRLAKKGDKRALEILVANDYKYPVPSYEWAGIIEVYADNNYRPAIPALISDTHAAYLHLAAAACTCLERMYPGCPKDFKTLEGERAYFQKRYDVERASSR